MDEPILDDLPDAILAADIPLETEVKRWLTPSPAEFKNYSVCPWAQTAVIHDHETGGYAVAAINCKRWGCAYCAPRKIRKLAFLTNGAAPNRWIRLGVKPDQYPNPEEAWRHTSPLVPETFRKMRSKLGPIEYLRVCELHQSGFPHYHALLRSPFIPQKLLSDTWGALTGARVVWIAKVDQSFSSFRYLTKYLTKLHRIEWTDRHVSYSKGFFRPEDTEKLKYAPREVVKREKVHPWKFLADYFPYEEIGVDAKGTWHVPSYPSMPERDTPLHAFGFYDPHYAERPNPPTQAQMTAFDTSPEESYADASF